MKTLLYLTAVVVLSFVLGVVLCFAAGWMTLRQDDEKAIIEVETGRMRQSAVETWQAGRNLFNQSSPSAEAPESGDGA